MVKIQTQMDRVEDDMTDQPQNPPLQATHRVFRQGQMTG